jgi:shikimate kinase
MTPERIARLAERLDRPLMLVGLMGSGKTTVGRRVARVLSRSFADADAAIEAAAALSVGEIFERYGEAHFRDGERRVVQRLVEEGHGVIATGGGAFCDPDTRAFLLDRTIPVWLDSPITTLVRRTARKTTRPLLAQGDPREILEELYRRRAPDYAQAPIRVVSEGISHETAAARILEEVDLWLS